MRKPVLLAAVVALLAAAPLLAGFAGTDVFLPMVGRQAGVGTSNWYTTVWIHNPGTEAATATVWLLERGTSNPTPPVGRHPRRPGRHREARGRRRRLLPRPDLRRHARHLPDPEARRHLARLLAGRRHRREGLDGPGLRGGACLVRHRPRRANADPRRPPDDPGGRLRVPLQLRLRRDHGQHRHRADPRARRQRRRAGVEGPPGAALLAAPGGVQGPLPGAVDGERPPRGRGGLRLRQGDRLRLRDRQRLAGPDHLRDGVPGAGAGGERGAGDHRRDGRRRPDRRRDVGRCDAQRRCSGTGSAVGADGVSSPTAACRPAKIQPSATVGPGADDGGVGQPRPRRERHGARRQRGGVADAGRGRHHRGGCGHAA